MLPNPAAEGFVYSAVESPKGELGVYLQGNGDSLPYRVRIRAPRRHAAHGNHLIALRMHIFILFTILLLRLLYSQVLLFDINHFQP